MVARALSINQATERIKLGLSCRTKRSSGKVPYSDEFQNSEVIMSASSVATRDIQSAPVVSSIIHTILESPPSCIEFSLLAPDLFVVGTYSLDTDISKDENALSPVKGEEVDCSVQLRSGSIIFFRLEGDKLYANPLLHY